MTRVLLAGFGGPDCLSEVRPFLDRILEGRNVPAARYEEVVSHYEIIGGRSPFKELTQRQASALEKELRARGVEADVSAAYRFSEPFIPDAVHELQRSGEPVVAVVLSALQSAASWDAYVSLLPGVRIAPALHGSEAVIDAHAQRVLAALQSLGEKDFSRTALIFTAHSIPLPMASSSPYVQQFESAAASVTQRVGAPAFHLAYTSRSGRPADPWLEPDIRDLLKRLGTEGTPCAVVHPLGFLCDHVEVLYDLDVEAAETARRSGIRMGRAAALNDHPGFIAAMADSVQECLR